MTRMTDAPVPLEDYVPSADRFVVLRGNWATYEALLAARREKRCPRISYLDGVLQVMSPSREHDLIGRTLAALVTEYCAETSVDCTLGGSWTLREALKEAGLEPDECFILGPAPDVKDRPDLAIEVIWTSGGIEKLEIYRRLGIGEVWFWQDNAIRVLVLRNDAYVQVDSSACLPRSTSRLSPDSRASSRRPLRFASSVKRFASRARSQIRPAARSRAP